jgi:hypothetical protein
MLIYGILQSEAMRWMKKEEEAMVWVIHVGNYMR